MLGIFLGVFYISGYVSLALLAAYGVRKQARRLVWGGLLGWTLWNVAWFTAAALIH